METDLTETLPKQGGRHFRGIAVSPAARLEREDDLDHWVPGELLNAAPTNELGVVPSLDGERSIAGVLHANDQGAQIVE